MSGGTYTYVIHPPWLRCRGGRDRRPGVKFARWDGISPAVSSAGGPGSNMVGGMGGPDPTWLQECGQQGGRCLVRVLDVALRTRTLTVVGTLVAAAWPATWLPVRRPRLLAAIESHRAGRWSSPQRNRCLVIVASHCRQRGLLVFSLVLQTIALIACEAAYRRTYTAILDSVKPAALSPGRYSSMRGAGRVR